MFFQKIHLLCFVVIWGLFSSSMHAQSTTSQLLNKADEAFKGERWKSASTLYTLLLQDSAQYTPLMSRALMADMLAQDEISLERAESVFLKNQFRLDSLLSDYSQLTIQQKHFDIFEETLLHMRGVMPERKDTLLYAVVQYRLFLRQPEHVISLIQQLVPEEGRTPQWLLLLANAFQMKGDALAALQEYEKIRALQPHHLDANLYIGNYYFLKGKRLISQLDAEYQARLNPTKMQYAAYRNELRRIYDENLSKARMILEQIYSDHPNLTVNKSLEEIKTIGLEIEKDELIKKSFLK